MNEKHNTPIVDADNLDFSRLERRKRKRITNTRRNNLNWILVISASAFLMIVIFMFAGGIPLQLASLQANLQARIRLPEYSFDEETIAAEKAVFHEQYPEMVNWTRLQSKDVSLWLPSEYRQIALDYVTEGEQIDATTRDSLTARQSEILDQYPDTYRLVAEASGRDVLVTRERTRSVQTLEQYMALADEELSSSMVIESHEEIELQGVPAIRYSMTQTIKFIKTTVLGYVVQDNEYFYMVIFSNYADRITEDDYAFYDQIMQTFRVSRTD